MARSLPRSTRGRAASSWRICSASVRISAAGAHGSSRGVGVALGFLLARVSSTAAEMNA